MTRWAVLREYPVTESDLDAAGTVADETLRRWVDDVRVAYLEQCSLLHQVRERDGLVLRHRTGTLPSAALLGRPARVFVTASVSEVRPSSFTVSVRLRPDGGDREMPLNAICVLRLEDADGEVRELGTGIRDELIALEHAAAHFN